MKRFFSHLPAWVEASAWGSSRASANIKAMGCSAVLIELPNGVFMTTMPRAVAAGMSTLSTPIPARPITLRGGGGGGRFSRAVGGGGGVERFCRDLGRRADGEAVIIGNDRLQFVLREARPLVGLDAARAE